VYRSLNHIYVQVIDDLHGTTLFQRVPRGQKRRPAYSGNVAAAKTVGKTIAERAKAKGVSKVVFDRGGYIYHGRVKALADAAREAGFSSRRKYRIKIRFPGCQRLLRSSMQIRTS